MIDNTATDMIKTVTDIIEEVKAEICDQYCKKLKECIEALDEGNDFYCPLDKL